MPEATWGNDRLDHSHIDRREGIEPAERSDHVLARLQDADDLRRVGEQRAVEDAVRIERQHAGLVAAREDADRAQAAQLADVAPDLVWRTDPGAGQLEVRVGDDPPDGRAADVPVAHWITRYAMGPDSRGGRRA
jgi:hypothetical protein